MNNFYQRDYNEEDESSPLDVMSEELQRALKFPKKTALNKDFFMRLLEPVIIFLAVLLLVLGAYLIYNDGNTASSASTIEETATLSGVSGVQTETPVAYISPSVEEVVLSEEGNSALSKLLIEVTFYSIGAVLITFVLLSTLSHRLIHDFLKL